MSAKPVTFAAASGLGARLLLLAAVLTVIGAPLIVLAGEQALPYSPEWWRAAGRSVGMAAALCLAVQFVIASRCRLLDRFAGLDRLFLGHRGFGIAAALLALSHPFIVFYPEEVGLGAPAISQWPLVAGATALTMLWGLAAVARWRSWLDLPFHLWLPAHRLAALGLALIVGLHASFVGGPFKAADLALPLVAAVYLLLRFAPRPLRCRVKSVTPLGGEAHELVLAPESGPVFDHAPGQFAFLTLQSPALPREEHPFTIASAPGEDALRFTIRCSGDYTARLGALSPGDAALVRGPYGRFSHLVRGAAPSEELLFLAGGVGITPMLSMLRHMAASAKDAPGADKRRVTLIWCNRTPEDAVHAEEIEALAATLPGFRLHHVFTRGPSTARLDGPGLSSLITDIPRLTRCFVCGPPPFMSFCREALRREGFAPSRIHLEEFAL